MRSPDQCIFLTTDMVREVHAAAIDSFGGSLGLREEALLESAVAAPRATFAGESVYGDAVEIAAAYLFFLCRNHPFVDGNKRTAFGACLLFLRLNHIEHEADSDDWEQLVLDVAASQLDRDATTKRLRKLVK